MHKLNWDDLRLFLSVARAGRLNQAGRHLGLDQTTVARRVKALEQGLGARVIERTPRGAQLTQAGKALLARAERVEAEIIAATADLDDPDTAIRGTVRLSTPEAFGTHVIAPNVSQLNAAHPMLRLELVPESQLVHLANREADLAVTLTLPSAGPIFVRRLVDYRLGLYASHDYIAARGRPETVADLRQHAMVGYIDDLIDLPELRVADSMESHQVVFRSTSSTAQYNAIVSGVGAGWLHSYIADHDPRLVRILDGVEEQRSYWLGVHRDQRDLPAVRAVIDFIDDLVVNRFGQLPDREAATVRPRE